MDLERLSQLATLDLTSIIPNENSVKYKIVIPFLQSFGHEHIDLEHAAQGSRIDINIGEFRVRSCFLPSIQLTNPQNKKPHLSI